MGQIREVRLPAPLSNYQVIVIVLCNLCLLCSGGKALLPQGDADRVGQGRVVVRHSTCDLPVDLR